MLWSALPQLESGRILLTVLAATALDDPHALDRGSSTATAVLRLPGHAIPDAKPWRFEARPPGPPRYEEQDLPLLLRDLRRTSA